MLLIREIFHCKPGKVRPLVEKFQAMSKVSEKAGRGKFRIMTDLCGERYWTLVAEMESPTLHAFEELMHGAGMTDEVQKEFGKIMEGHHELIQDGRREIFRIEG